MIVQTIATVLAAGLTLFSLARAVEILRPSLVPVARRQR